MNWLGFSTKGAILSVINQATGLSLLEVRLVSCDGSCSPMVLARSTAWNILNLRLSLLGLCLLALFCLLALAGCDQSKLAPSPPPTPLTAEERFENFLVALKEQVEPHDSFSTPGDGEGTASASWEAQVSHQLIPAVDGKPMRAVLSIHRKSEVTVLLPEPGGDEERAKKAAQDEEQRKLAKEFVPELLEATGGGNSASRIASSSIRTLPNNDVSQYEMQYNGKMWEMVTPLDPNERPFTTAAIKLALSRQ